MARATRSSQTMTLLFAVLASAGASEYQSVRLMDIETLTLVAGRVTAARRGPAVPQLDCRGSLCTSEFMPTTVQCVNRGSDGSSVQWKCDADLDNRVKFGHIVVTCEGFSFTGDSTVLIGSCGLEYELLGTNVAARGGHETHQAVGPILGLLVIAIVLLVCVCICICLSFDRGGARAPVIVGGSPVILAASPPWYYSSWGGSGSSYSSSSSGRSGGGGGGSRSASGFGGSRSR
jgi:hypothetical protein